MKQCTLTQQGLLAVRMKIKDGTLRAHFLPRALLLLKMHYICKSTIGVESRNLQSQNHKEESVFKALPFFSEMEENCQRSLQNFKAQEIGNRNLRKPVLEFKGATRSPWQKNGIK